eukprot:scaffold8254_cov108-Isochrysis_galbana.AAC.1
MGSAALHWARRRGIPALCSHHTRWGAYLDYYPSLPARYLLRRLSWWHLKRFHAQCAVTLPPSVAVKLELEAHGVGRVVNRTAAAGDQNRAAAAGDQNRAAVDQSRTAAAEDQNSAAAAGRRRVSAARANNRRAWADENMAAAVRDRARNSTAGAGARAGFVLSGGGGAWS